MFLMRFDMRVPEAGEASARDLYAAALDMAEWGEANGCVMAVVSEHHGSMLAMPYKRPGLRAADSAIAS